MYSTNKTSRILGSQRALRSALARSILLALGVAGCNTILDNKPGQPQTATPESVDPTQPTTGDAGTQTAQAEDVDSGGGGGGGGTTVTTPPDDAGNASSQCATFQHFCSGACVDNTNPLYGCGSPSCTPCEVAHGTPTCQAGKCAVLACDQGYGDCNQKADDGCEIDLSLATSCGSCNAVCPAASPVCAPSGASFQCGTGCTPAAPLLCGAECVSPLNSTNDCGGCNVKCPDVANSTTSCVLGGCKFTCKAGYHACGSACAQDTDVTACGPSCAPCPAVANATPTCPAAACSFQCNAGFGNCNGNGADGCEATLATDPINCGTCGKSCNGGTCQAGVCKPAGDAGP